MSGISPALLLPAAEDRRRGASFWVTLAALVILAAVPRLYQLGHPGLSGNEDYAAIAARAIRDTGIPRFPSGVIYPRAPLVSYVTAASMGVLGENELATRLPWALLSALAVGLAYVFARRVFGRDVALLVGLFLALSSWEITTGRTARMYAPLSIAFLFALYSMHKVAFEDDGRFRIPNIVATILTCSLHQLGATLIIPYAIAFLMGRQVNRRAFVALAIAVLMVAAGAQILFEKHHYAGFEARVAARPAASGAESDGEKDAPRVLAIAVLAGGLALAIGIRRPGASFLAALATTVTLLGMQQVAPAFYAAAAFLAWVAFVRGRWSWLEASILGGALTVGAAGWLAFLVAGPSRLSPVRAMREIAGSPPNFLEVFARHSPVVFGVAVVGMGVVLARFFRDRRSFAPHVVVIAAFVLTATALGLYPDARFNERYVFHLHPYLAFLFAAGAWWLAAWAAAAIVRDEGGARHARAVSIVLAIGLMLGSGGISPSMTVAAAVQRYGENERLGQGEEGARFNPDHAGSSSFVCSRAAPGDFIVPMDILIHWVYCPRADIQLTMSPKGDAEGWIGIHSVDSLRAVGVELARSRAQRVWLVTSGHAIHTYRDDPRLPAAMAFSAWDCARRVYAGRDGLSDVWVMDRACFLRHALQ